MGATAKSTLPRVLFAYAADRTTRPTYICLPVGLVHARSGRVVERIGPKQEVTPLPGIHFFDAWRVEPCCEVPTDLPEAQNGPEEGKFPSPRHPQERTKLEQGKKKKGTFWLAPAKIKPTTAKHEERCHQSL